MEVTPTSPGTILLGKMAYHTKQIRRECNIGLLTDFTTDQAKSKQLSIPLNKLPWQKTPDISVSEIASEIVKN